MADGLAQAVTPILELSVSEEERQSHCAHLEHMLNHMILHLQDVCTGLGELAAKTRIKIGETTKDIFQIQVPPWQDAAARTSIRDYLNALTAELDRADEGEEPEVKSRAILEKKAADPANAALYFRQSDHQSPLPQGDEWQYFLRTAFFLGRIE